MWRGTHSRRVRPVDIGRTSTNRGRAVWLLVLALSATGCGWFDRPASVDPKVLEPLPSGLEAVRVGSYPCRGSGDIGWEYEYVVVLGDDGAVGGRLYSHLEASGFGLRASGRDDWVVSVGTKGDILLRLGPVARWRESSGPILEGPIEFEVDGAVDGWEGPAALIGLEPTGEVCEV